MIQALRIVDIANAATKRLKKTITRSRVQYHCRKKNYQHVVLPIKKLYPLQSSEITLYIPGFRVMKDNVQVNPVRMVPIPEGKAQPGKIDVWATYWNKMRFYKLPAGHTIEECADAIKIS